MPIILKGSLVPIHSPFLYPSSWQPLIYLKYLNKWTSTHLFWAAGLVAVCSGFFPAVACRAALHCRAQALGSQVFSSCSTWAWSWYVGFSSCGTHRLSSCSSWPLEHTGFRSCGMLGLVAPEACEIFSNQDGTMSPALAGGILNHRASRDVLTSLLSSLWFAWKFHTNRIV